MAYLFCFRIKYYDFVMIAMLEKQRVDNKGL